MVPLSGPRGERTLHMVQQLPTGYTLACMTRVRLLSCLLLSVHYHNIYIEWCTAADGSKTHTLPPSHVHHPNQRSNPASRLAASQHHPPQCLIAPANAGPKKLPQLPLHSFHKLRQTQPHTSHASPRTQAEGANPRPRQFHGDDAENNHFAHFQSPVSPQMGSQTAQKRRKQKRPLWQDVSLDLSAIQAAQEQAGPEMSHADRPVGRSLSTDTVGAAHMSGVSPASPSPPKQHPQNAPFPQHKSRSNVPTLPALASADSYPPEAFAARHENLGFDLRRQSQQQYQHGLGQNVGASGGAQPFASVLLRASQQQHSSQVQQLPNCLPPLHYQPHAPSLQSSADHAPLHWDGATQAHQHRHMSWSCDRTNMHTSPPMSSTHHAYHASDDALPSTSHRHAEGLHGFAPGPSRQAAAYEDPRSAQQVPLQYLRHPCGPGAPGGLHRLHRLLSPLDRSQHRDAESNSFIHEASNTAWATGAVTEHPQHSDDSSHAAAAAEPEPMQHPWHAQPPHAQPPHAQPPQHQQCHGSMERKGKPEMMHQQPVQQAPAAHHTAYGGWQEDGVSAQQHQPGMPVGGLCNSTCSRDAQAAGDMQDVNTRLQQV